MPVGSTNFRLVTPIFEIGKEKFMKRGLGMKKILFQTAPAALVITASVSPAQAHFGVIIPSDDIVSEGDRKKINLQIKFIHPFEGRFETGAVLWVKTREMR